MQFPHDTNRRTLKNRRISTIRFQHLKYTQGNCMRNCWMTEGQAAAPVGGGGAWPDNESTRPPQTHFAHNFPRSLLEIARKHCNPNDMNSIFEVLAGELRAKLLWRGPLHPLRAAAPVTRRDTRSEGVYCLRIGCSAPNHKSNRGNCETRAWLRRLWAVAGPGRTTSRCAEQSSRRGWLAGGPPPTGASSSPAPRPGQTAPGTPATPQATRAYKNAHPLPGGRI